MPNDQQNLGGDEPKAEKKKTSREPTRYVVLVDSGDGVTFHRVGGEGEESEAVFEGSKRDVLNDALDFVPDDQKDHWLIPVPERSFKGARRQPPKPRRESFEFE